MALLLSGTKLRRRLQELAKESDRIDVAVAWATSWDGLDEVLKVAKSYGKDRVRIVVGVAGFVTSPMAIRKIESCALLRIYERRDQLLFHPKFYTFHTPKGRFCWVGSANLTSAAFGGNIEAVAEINDIDDSFLNHFEELWGGGQAVGSFDFKAYEVKWKEAAKRRPHFLRHESDVSPDVLKEGWVDYASKLRATSGFKSRLETLTAGYRFVRRDWKKPLISTSREFAIMFGLTHGDESFKNFGSLGSILRFRPENNFQGSSRQARANRMAIGNALNRLVHSDRFSADSSEESLAELRQIEGCDLSLATRLLLFARPDWFVVWTKKSRGWLKEEFKIELNEKPTTKQYVELVEAIQKRAWWQSPPPRDRDERKLWKYRTALIDCFAFENYQKDGAQRRRRVPPL